MSTVLGQEENEKRLPELTHEILKMKNHGYFGEMGKPPIENERLLVIDAEPKVNVGTPGHIDHGNNDPIHLLSQSPTAPLNGISEFAPPDIEYEMDDWKAKRPSNWTLDAKIGGKKRNKAKAKAQKFARKRQRKK